MTLLVAGLQGQSAWMVADSFISGGTLELRERVHRLKIVRAIDSKGLIGFAGDEHHGTRMLEEARLVESGPAVVELLLAAHRSTPSVEFAYAQRVAGKASLFKIAGGRAKSVPTLHLGNGFRRLQAIRNRKERRSPPDTVTTVYYADKSHLNEPPQLADTTTALIHLFAERPERDVGGFALPYFLNEEGAFLLNYNYAVSDPDFADGWKPRPLGTGTAERGGFNLTLTELGSDQGVVAYWRQRPGGFAFVRDANGYKTIPFAGAPSAARAVLSDKLGMDVDLFVSDVDVTAPFEKVLVLRASDGSPAISIAKSGRSLSLSNLSRTGDFDVKARIEMDADLPSKKIDGSESK
jgi:hypothetical protein